MFFFEKSTKKLLTVGYDVGPRREPARLTVKLFRAAGIVGTEVVGLDGDGAGYLDDAAPFRGNHFGYGEAAQAHRGQRVGVVIGDPVVCRNVDREARGVARGAASGVVDEDFDVAAEDLTRLGVDGRRTFVG